MVQVQTASRASLAQISHFCWLKTTSALVRRLPTARPEYSKISGQDGKESSSHETGRAQKPHSEHLTGQMASAMLQSTIPLHAIKNMDGRL
jgi:hypothetical protein